MDLILRKLKEEDAKKSYLWRLDDEIWKFTISRPPKKITYEIEKKWIQTVLRKNDERRFAICVGEKMEYIGNVQLTNIDKSSAEFHIFIGKKENHNIGLGTKATKLILDYATKELKLNIIYLYVNKNNIAAIKSYKKCGFYEVEKNEKIIKLSILLKNEC